MLKFLLALKICICLLGITLGYAQNPVIFERRIGIFPDGSERIFEEKYWDRTEDGSLVFHETKLFSYQGEKQVLRERVFEQYFPDSTHTDRIKYDHQSQAYEGNVHKEHSVETYIPAQDKRLRLDSTWLYGEDLAPFLSRVKRFEQNQSSFAELEHWFNPITDMWEEPYSSTWETKEVRNANGCLVESSFISNGQMTSQTLYSVDENCEVSLRVRRTYDFQRQLWNADSTFRYEEGGYIIEENPQRYFKQVWEKASDRLLESIELSNGRIHRTLIEYTQAGDSLITISTTQSRAVSGSIWRNEKRRRKIEIKGRYEQNLTYRNWSTSIGKYKNKGEYTIVNNDEGDRIFTFNTSYVYNEEEGYYLPQFIMELYGKYDYNLYCDGELREKVIYGNEWNSGLLRKMSRIEYGYLHPSDCGEATDLIQVYPNPVSPDGILTITREAFSGSAGARLTDLQGRVIKSIPMIGRSPLVRISLNGITPGLYLLQVEVEGVWGMVEKLMVR